MKLVIQVGLPSDREQYIHRLGGTGRKGKEGQGILLLATWEDFFLNTIKDIPMSKATLPMVDPDVRQKRKYAEIKLNSQVSFDCLFVIEDFMAAVVRICFGA